MKVLKPLFKNNFWVSILIIYSVVSISSYLFLAKLFFWREDYQLVYSYFAHIPYYSWPYQGISLIYYPLHLLFGNQPLGYFTVILISYILLAWCVAYFAYKITLNKSIAFWSGLLFAAGYIGSENQILIMAGFTNNLYLCLLIILLILYQRMIRQQKSFSWAVFLLYSLNLTIFSHRSYNLFFILVLADIYFQAHANKISIKFIKSWFKKLYRLIPYFITTAIVYLLFPHLFPAESAGTDAASLAWYTKLLPKFIYLFNLNFFWDIGNSLFPTDLQNKILASNFIISHLRFKVSLLIILLLGLLAFITTLKSKLSSSMKITYYVGFIGISLIFFKLAENNLDLLLGSMMGLWWISIVFGFIIFAKAKYQLKLTVLFLILLYIISYIFFHIVEYDISHPSWHRYLFLGFPFYSILICSILSNFKRSYLIIVGLVFINFFYNQTSEFTKINLERSADAKRFFRQLTQIVPTINGKTLFYIDYVQNNTIPTALGRITASGIFPGETALAAIYSTNISNLKIVDSYSDFKQAEETHQYPASYSLFYNQNKDLINTTSQTSEGTKNQSINLKLAKVYPKSANGDQLQFQDKLIYLSTLEQSTDQTNFYNKSIEINMSDLPDTKPINIRINAAFESLLPEINQFPLINNDGSSEILQPSIDNDIYRQTIINYVNDRRNFQRLVKVSSNGIEKPGLVENAVDNDPETSWLSNKKVWVNGGQPWLQLDFPTPYSVSEIRWISNYLTRTPTLYQYQYLNSQTNTWITILTKQNPTAKRGDYIIDNFPEVSAKSFRMVIFSTTGNDFPAISEIELLKNNHAVDSKLANLMIDRPLEKVSSQATAQELLDNLGSYLHLTVYPISDKYPALENSLPLNLPIIIDGQYHNYDLVIPSGGVSLRKIIIKFPNIPIKAYFKTLIATP